jgi:heptaprenyl diphosphate synthase
LTSLSLLLALAMILSYLESLVPPILALPGIKLGLANAVSLFALYRLGARYAIPISLLRVFLSALLFGSIMSLVFSLAGALLSLLAMILLRAMTPLSPTVVSVVGAVCHNIGQIAVAALLLSTSLIYYLGILIISGVISGVLIGLLTSYLIKRIKI